MKLNHDRQMRKSIAIIITSILVPVSYTHLDVYKRQFVTLMGIITGDRVNGAARWMTFMGLQLSLIHI